MMKLHKYTVNGNILRPVCHLYSSLSPLPLSHTHTRSHTPNKGTHFTSYIHPHHSYGPWLSAPFNFYLLSAAKHSSHVLQGLERWQISGHTECANHNFKHKCSRWCTALSCESVRRECHTTLSLSTLQLFVSRVILLFFCEWNLQRLLYRAERERERQPLTLSLVCFSPLSHHKEGTRERRARAILKRMPLLSFLWCKKQLKCHSLSLTCVYVDENVLHGLSPSLSLLSPPSLPLLEVHHLMTRNCARVSWTNEL